MHRNVSATQWLRDRGLAATAGFWLGQTQGPPSSCLTTSWTDGDQSCRMSDIPRVYKNSRRNDDIVMSEQNCLFAAVRAVVGLSHCR